MQVRILPGGDLQNWRRGALVTSVRSVHAARDLLNLDGLHGMDALDRG